VPLQKLEPVFRQPNGDDFMPGLPLEDGHHS
jgi:hypothetical protein